MRVRTTLVVTLVAACIFANASRGDWSVDADWRSTCDGDDVTGQEPNLVAAITEALDLLDEEPKPYPSECDPPYYKHIVSIGEIYKVDSARYRVKAEWRKRSDETIKFSRPVIVEAQGARNAVNSVLYELTKNHNPDPGAMVSPYENWDVHIMTFEQRTVVSAPVICAPAPLCPPVAPSTCFP